MLTQLLQQKEELSDYCKEQKIHGFEERLRSHIDGYCIANGATYKDEPQLKLQVDALNYALNDQRAIPAFLRQQLAYREEAEQNDGYHYGEIVEEITVPALSRRIPIQNVSNGPQEVKVNYKEPLVVIDAGVGGDVHYNWKKMAAHRKEVKETK